MLNAVARYRGLCHYFFCDPGACAPGFMLSPASRARAKPVRLIGSGLLVHACSFSTSIEKSKTHEEERVREADGSIKPGAQAPGYDQPNIIEPAKRVTAPDA